MEVFKAADKIRYWSTGKTRDRLSVSLVPTMGALHKAHRSIIKRSVLENDITIVSIFVNPIQFSPGEDYESYPEDFKSDRNICEVEKVDAVFNPPVTEMYSQRDLTRVTVGGNTDFMCGAHRPGHFNGVATVVAKLFNIIHPARAYFGLKDYQQFQVIKKMNEDLKMGVELKACPTVREKDGLALSSRNKYLNRKQRKQAPHIYKALMRGREEIEKGEKDGEKIAEIMRSRINKNISGGKIDYVGVYHARNLRPLGEVKGDVVLAAAVWMGKARLIDNIPVKLK